MFVEDEAPGPEPHPRGARRRLGPGRRCRGKHLTLAFWAAPPLGPGSRCAGGPGERRQLGAGRRLPPPACCTLGSQPSQAARRAAPAGGTRLRAARGGRSHPLPGPAPTAPTAPPRCRRGGLGAVWGGGGGTRPRPPGPRRGAGQPPGGDGRPPPAARPAPRPARGRACGSAGPGRVGLRFGKSTHRL